MLKFWDLSGAKDCKSCRSRKTLQNDYLVAIVAVHTAENEPSKVWAARARARAAARQCARWAPAKRGGPMPRSRQIFRRLVLGWIDSYDSNQILIFSGFSRSTRFSYFCTAQISKFQRKTVEFFAGMKMNFFFLSRFSMKYAIFLRNFDEILPEFHRNVQEMTKQRWQYL